MPKPLLVAVPIAASILIVGGIIASLWLIGSASGERAKFSSLEIAPKQTDAFFAINTDPTSPQWIAVNDSLGAVGAKDPIRRAIDEALAEVNLDWEGDILPVSGDEAFFSIPSFEDVQGSSGFVAGFRIADRDKAQDVFDDLRERAEDEGEAPLEEEDYEGVTIYYSLGSELDVAGLTGSSKDDFCHSEGYEMVCDGEDSPSGSVAFFEDVLAVGGSPDDVKMVIDVVQGREPSAEENERLQEFREAKRGDFLMWGYADLAAVWDMAESGFATELGGTGSDSPVETPEPPTATPRPTQTETATSDFSIPSFAADYTIDANGSLQVTETIRADFGTVEKHGIFRDFDTRIPYNFIDDEIILISPLSVMRDGTSESFEATSQGDDVFRLKIGDPATTMTGVHTYEIKYSVLGGIHQWTTEIDPYYEVILNATGNWGVPIEKASVTFTPPNGALAGRSCMVGPDPAAELFFSDVFEGCSAEVSDMTASFESSDPIAPGSGFGFLVGVQGESGAPPPVLVPNEDYDFGDDPFDGFDEEPSEPTFPFTIDSEEIFDELRGTYDRVGFAVSSTSDGFAFDVTVLHAEGFDPELAFEPTQAFDSHFADRVPADTMFFFAGHDIYNQNWLPLRDYLDGIEFNDGETMDDFLDTFADETGLDLEDDILSLLTGEYAIAGDVSDFDDPDPSILSLFDVADADDARSVIDDIGDYLEDQGVAEIDDEDGIQRWTDTGDSGLDPIGVTVSGDAMIVGYPDSAVEDAVEGFDGALSGTKAWKRTIGLLPGDTTTVGFLSVARILEEVRRMDGAADSVRDVTDGELNLDDLEAIKAVGYATTSRGNGFGVHFVLFIED